MCDPDNVAYLACFLDAAISAAAPAEDADPDMYYYYYCYFFTLGIKDPEGFGKKLEENVSE